MPLNSNAYLTIAETKEWLKIKSDDTSKDTILTRLINTACAMVERYIDGPVLTREFVEFRDGNSSNVITPTYSPVVSLTEVRIDYNRQFSDATIVDSLQTILRGMPDLRQPSISIVGQDIVLRDDNNTALLGRIFAGSVVQSIKLTYRAGWGPTEADLPSDLVQATLMAVEYFYIMRENFDLGFNSRTNMGGQSYRRERTDSGLPTEVELMLDRYKDYSLGITDVPAKNTFTL